MGTHRARTAREGTKDPSGVNDQSPDGSWKPDMHKQSALYVNIRVPGPGSTRHSDTRLPMVRVRVTIRVPAPIASNQGRNDWGIWVFIPPKSAQVHFLWGKNDVRTTIQQFYTPKKLLYPPKKKFWLRPCKQPGTGVVCELSE